MISDVASEIEIQSGNVDASQTPIGDDVEPDRRTRKHLARREALLDVAGDLAESGGVDAVTIAAVAEAADYAPASLYTYFPSRSALMAALQKRALAALHVAAKAEVARWESLIDPPTTPGATFDAIDVSHSTPTSASASAPERIGALAKLWAFADLFLTGPQRSPRHFGLQQQLMSSSPLDGPEDRATVVPTALLVLEIPRDLLDQATRRDALTLPDPQFGPNGEPLNGTATRTLEWVAALNGALLVDNLSEGVSSSGYSLGISMTKSMLVGWGGDAAEVAAAFDLAEERLFHD